MRRGHGVRGACSQRGPQGGQGGQPRGNGPLLGRTACPRGRSGSLLIAICVVGRLGRGTPGVRGVLQGPPCPLLEDVEGRLLVVQRGCSVHCMPRQVVQHCPACVVLVCTQGAFRWFRGPSRRGKGTDFRMAPSVAGSKGRLASGTVCGAKARPGAAASRACVAGAGPRLRTASRCASACSHACQCVAPIWRSGLPLHRRSWKACSEWYTVVGTASRSSRSAGCAAAGHTPGLAARALSFSRTWSRRAWCSLSRSALTIMRVQSATGTTALGPGRRSGSQTTMCTSAGLNRQTGHCGFCCPRSAAARAAAGRAGVIRQKWAKKGHFFAKNRFFALSWTGNDPPPPILRVPNTKKHVSGTNKFILTNFWSPSSPKFDIFRQKWAKKGHFFGQK